MAERLLQLVPSIATIYTDEYPPRNIAYVHHRTWVENIPQEGAVDGFEYAAYYEPYPNCVSGGTIDAIFIEILAHNDGNFLFLGYATKPDLNREEFKINESYTNYKDAKRKATKWLSKAQKFINMQKRQSIVNLPDPG